VSLNIFSVPFPFFLLLLSAVICTFENVLVLMDTIGEWSTSGQLFYLLFSVSFHVCFGRFTKNHRPFIVPLYDNICCAYLDDISVCCSLGVHGYFLSMPPYRIGRPLWLSSTTSLLDLCLVTRLRRLQSVLYWRRQPVKYKSLGCSPSGVLWHPIQIWWWAPHLIWDIRWW
jgi:hypothetical protein